jgi:hypothetical protein
MCDCLNDDSVVIQMELVFLISAIIESNKFHKAFIAICNAFNQRNKRKYEGGKM